MRANGRIVGAAAAVIAVLTVLAAATASADERPKPKPEGPSFRVKALAFTTFPGERGPWLAHETWDLEFTVPGAYAPVQCQSKSRVCVTMTGTTKSNSGPSAMAILKDPQFKFTDKTVFVTSAIAGIRSSVGTLGTVGIADWIVDLELGSHLLPDQAPPDGWLPFDDYEGAAFHLNETLTAKAYELTKDVPLLDDEASRTERAKYGPAEAVELPAVQRCDNGAADGFWVGTYWADKADRILGERIRKLDPTYDGYRCSSEFEDGAIASVLKRFGYLDQFVTVRSASDLEDAWPGASDRDVYDLLHSDVGYAGYQISRENAYRVATKIAHSLGG